MNPVSQLIERGLRLGPPLTRDLTVERDLPVPMPDGTVLLADRWAPRAGGDKLPVALLRSPYGLATLDWVIRQPWFGDSIVLTGVSYLGYVQWAVAGQLPPQVKAMIPQLTESALTLDFLRADAFSLETPFGWGVLIAGQERRLGMLRGVLETGKTRRALATRPLADADLAALGQRSRYLQDILAHDADDPYWAAINHRDRVAATAVPVSSVAGWYDIFLPGQLRDFGVLQAAGRPARLTVGPWTHLSMDGTPLRETLEFGLACARGEQPPPRAPVRLYVMGEDTWRDFASWPPSGYSPRPFYLGADGSLGAEPPAGPTAVNPVAAGSAPDGYRYDPAADPTPAAGGARMVRGGAGRVDNTALEARPDVLTYTTVPLEADTEVIGEVSARIWFRSTRPYADVFVRLCDVDPRGRSGNVCDGLVSLSGADQLSRAEVRLWPTAYRFKRGHRIRVQVSSGAFPRFARNSGTGEPRATAMRLLAADQSVYHDPEHPSAITLPVQAG